MLDATETVTAFMAAYNAHAWDGAVAFYAEDATHAEGASPRTRTGRDEIAAGLRGFGAMLPDAVWAERERINSGPHVLLRYDLTGTFTPRDGDPRPLRLPGIFMFTLTEGRITATVDYWDKDQFLAQIR
ncbi:MAG TPA: nuclear transport factor 2 family protein [Paenirhodobacter sp.]